MDNRHLPWLLALVTAIAYTAVEAFRPFPFSWLLKALPALALLQWSLGRHVLGPRPLLYLALAAAACGDIALDFGHNSHLVPGLGAFSITQLCLCLLLWRQAPGRPSWQWVTLPVGTLVFLWLIWPYLDGRAPLLALYSLLLTAMVMGAVRANLNWQSQLGAALFLISDSMIAIDTFVYHSQLGMTTIFVTYFAALMLLVTGLTAPRSESGTGRPVRQPAATPPRQSP
ncbi:lysoplasmalogenase family protein [Ferrimonas sp.]|uniref:lysoplasmalogenase family protein n=1 Tax=Ferrimonas sp. TaxID=2080861 RepID=UPI003A8D8953